MIMRSAWDWKGEGVCEGGVEEEEGEEEVGLRLVRSTSRLPTSLVFWQWHPLPSTPSAP